MAPDKSTIMRSILTEAADVITNDIKAYVTEHQEITSRHMKANSMDTAETSTHAAHLKRFLGGLSAEQKLSMKYLLSLWEDHSKASAKYVLKMGLKLVNNLPTGDVILATAASLNANQGKQKELLTKCPKHPFLFHKWAR